jgi:ferredoxin
LKVVVDADKCLGFGRCVIVAPDVFRLVERPGQGVFRSNAKLDVLDESGGKSFENLRTAAQSCQLRQSQLLIGRRENESTCQNEHHELIRDMFLSGLQTDCKVVADLLN